MGYELYVKTSDSKNIYEKLIEKGKKYNLSNCGMHALDTMRMESGFLHWGHDISPEENQYQAGLNFTISYKKEFNFIGREALEKIKDKKIDRQCLLCLSYKNNEPENYSFNFNKNLSFGYIKSDLTHEELIDKSLTPKTFMSF